MNEITPIFPRISAIVAGRLPESAWGFQACGISG
jgi:hypothetical protein